MTAPAPPETDRRGWVRHLSDPRGSVVAALGVTQIIGYGTLYYAFPILVPALSQDFDVGAAYLFGLLSFGLLLGGLAAPTLGRSLDRFGAARVMSWGSLAMAVLLMLLAIAPNFGTFAIVMLLIEVISFAVLYDAAFATLGQKRPGDTRRAITRLTLIAGFASTIFWPLTGWLVQELGWRGVQGVFAALNLFIAFPLHRWIARGPQDRPDRPTAGTAAAAAPVFAMITGAEAQRAFVLLGIGFALTGMGIAALGVHLVPILLAQGLGEMAYIAAMIMGPAQVAIRVVDATALRHQHPLAVAILSAAAIPVALVLLILPGPAPVMAIAIAVLLGVGGGLSSIVRGSVPVALFGTSGLGLRLGRLAAIRSVLGAASPFLFALAAEQVGIGFAVSAALALTLLGLAAVVALHLQLSASGAVPPLRRP